MADYTKLNLKQDVEDMAEQFGMAPNIEARYARKPLGLENSGVSYFRLEPDFRLPFGHTHGEQEEVYVVISGSARVKAGDDIVELAPSTPCASPARRRAAWRRAPTARRSSPSARPTPTTRTLRCCRTSGRRRARRP